MISDYFRSMAKDGRLVTIDEDNEFLAFVTFSICDDYRVYQLKDLWEYLPHNPTGFICFIEKLAAKKWNKNIRKKLEEAILNKFPQIEETVWFRPTKTDEERKVTRRIHAKA